MEVRTDIDLDLGRAVLNSEAGSKVFIDWSGGIHPLQLAMVLHQRLQTQEAD